MTTTTTRPMDERKLDAFVSTVVGDLAANYAGVMVSMGRKLGLYRTMAGAGPIHSHELASRSGCHERYVREWLNSQAAGGYVVYHPSSETYELPAEHAHVLADEESPMYMAPAWDIPASMWLDEERTLDAFRTGRGMPWGAHDERMYRGVAAFFRNAYQGQLVGDWLPSLDGMVERLECGARVADVGCGFGHSTLIMAQAFPRSRFVGLDSHGASIDAARGNARDSQVDERVEFRPADAKEAYGTREFDLVCFFDCLHDMGDPVAAAARAREALVDDGMALIVEPFAHDRVEENLNAVGRLYYSASATLCCPHAMSEPGGFVLGAQAGEGRLTAVLRQAGFRRVRRALATPFNLILEARP
ncbi:MAG TPA: class I SAM-dependent methyltransferase [bacterium]|nr:class I SAM-dependent methyltransferase [bacterium]